MDEYGEFIDEDENEGAEFFGQHAYDTDDREPELPGLTDEAKRLLEVAREEAEAEEPHTPVVPLAVSAFMTSRKKAAAAELADWMDSRGGSRLLAGVDRPRRCRGATTAGRAPW